MSAKSNIQAIVSGAYNWFLKNSGLMDETSEVIPLAPVDFTYEGMNHINNYFKIQQERKILFRDLDTMDLMSPEIHTALNIYADNSVKGPTANGSFTINITEGDSPEVQECFKDFEHRSKIRYKQWSIARNITKNGEDFWEQVASEDGLVKIKYLPANTMWVDVDAYGRPVDPTKFFIQRGESDKIIATWPIGSVVHFKLEGDLRTPYGQSLLYSARRLFRQIHMMEDAMVIARARRAHARYVFNVDTGNLQQESKLLALDNYKKRNMTRRMIDPTTGQVRTEDVPLRVEEDIFLGKDDKVDLLQGDISVTHIQDVQYFLGKMYTALGVPKAFMARDETVNAKATLTQQDIQFGRSVQRVQTAMAVGFKEMYQFALAARGIDPDTVKFEIVFPEMNVVDKLLGWEVMQVKGMVAGILRDDLQMFGTDWCYKNVFEITEAEMTTVKSEIEIEKAQRLKELLTSPPIPGDGSTADTDGTVDDPNKTHNAVQQGISRNGAPNVFPNGLKEPQPRAIQPRPPVVKASPGAPSESRSRHFRALREALEDSPETLEILESLSVLLDGKLSKLGRKK